MAYGDLLKSDIDAPGGGDTTSCDLGSNPTSGNLLIYCAYGGSGGQSVSTPPSGFTLLEDQNTSFVGAVYYKISVGTEQTASHVHSNTNAVGAFYGEFDTDGETLDSVQSDEDVTNVSSTVTSQQAGSLTPSNTKNIALAFAYADGTGSPSSGEAWDESYTLDVGFVADSSVVAVGKKTDVSGSQTPTFSHTGTADQMYGVLVIVNFTVAGGGTPSHLTLLGVG